MYISKQKAFTIIELLIVIVVIGILVGITVVVYPKLTRSAQEKALQAELTKAAGEVNIIEFEQGSAPRDLSSLTPTKKGSLAISIDPTKRTWCLTINPNPPNSQNLSSYSIDGEKGGIQEGFCPSPNIQTITKATCPTELTQVKDARDNHSYYIKKLADNQCWMLTNLAYAGGTSNGGSNTYSDVVNQGSGVRGTNTIYGPDNAGTPTYTEARYYIPSGANPTIDPTPPSTSTDGGVTNPQFGYLYNWCAAMGGQNTAACANATTPAPIPTTNICPAGWRLPTGGNGRELVMLNTAINDGRIDTDAGLLTHGFFQYGSFWNQGFGGRWGHYWSSSQYFTTSVHVLFFGSSTVDAVSNKSGHKSLGQAVRCIAE